VKKQKQKQELISIPSLCSLYEKDPSQLRKMIKKLNIVSATVRSAETNRIVTAITDEEHQLLVDTYPNLTAKNAGKSFIPVSIASKQLGYREDQMSNFTRACKSFGFELLKRKYQGRTRSCISIKDYKKFSKIRGAIAIADV